MSSSPWLGLADSIPRCGCATDRLCPTAMCGGSKRHGVCIKLLAPPPLTAAGAHMGDRCLDEWDMLLLFVLSWDDAIGCVRAAKYVKAKLFAQMPGKSTPCGDPCRCPPHRQRGWQQLIRKVLVGLPKHGVAAPIIPVTSRDAETTLHIMVAFIIPSNPFRSWNCG